MKIKVSAHQFKTKELATSKVDAILSHRRKRIESIMKDQVVQEKEYELINKRFVEAVDKIDKLDKEDKNYSSEFDKLTQLKEIIEYNLNNERELLLKITERTRKERSNYRHSNKNVYCDYKCIGKCSHSSQWVFSNERSR